MNFPRLKSVMIEPTNKCNFECVFCHRTKRKQGFINRTMYARILYELLEFRKVPRIGLSHSGEPLLHPDFPDLLGVSLSLDFKVLFCTNA